MDKRESDRIKKGVLDRRLTGIVVRNYILFGTLIIIVTMVIFVYSLLWDRYEATVEIGKSISEVLQTSADISPLVDAVLSQERNNTEEFKKLLADSVRTDNEGQLLSYKWYTQEDPPLAKRDDYKETTDIFYAYNSNFKDLNGTSLMVFDKKTHIAALLCDVEKFGEAEPVAVDYMMWRTFEDVELDKIEEERWSLFKNLYHYMKVDIRYVAFAWYEPYSYHDEDVVVFIEADAFYKRLWNNVFASVVVFFVFVILVVFLMAIFDRKRIHRVVAVPVNKLAEAAKSYVTAEITEERSRYFDSLGINTGDEYEELSHTLGDMENKIIDYEEDLKKVAEERARLSTELSIAAKIQKDMLTTDFFSERKEFALYASMDAAKEVGGDFYDAFLIDEDHLCMVMADVSGKGVPASLFMAKAMTTIRTIAGDDVSPSEILRDVNNILCQGNQAQMFVTVWLGILEISTGELVEANGGHENPVIRTGEEGFSYIKTSHGFVLGGIKNVKYKDDVLQLKPGDTFFIYTDGVLEATNSEGMRFGNDRLPEVLDEVAGEPPERILAHVRERVEEFVGDAPQFDDLTMLSIVYRPG